jgi:hypothetical protein
VLELAAGLIPGLFMAVVAGASGQWGNGQAKAVGGQVTQAAGAREAAVANSVTFGISKGDTAAGSRVI